MECNKDEAVRARDIAETKMEHGDFEVAQKLALKAQNLYPELENITQLLSICDVHCSAQKRIVGSEKDWYAILQVERLADELTVKKQYRRLALILHPDKNRFPGAEAAFKLICEANAVLSDSLKKSLYDNKIKVFVRSAPVNLHINTNFQPNKQYGAHNNVPNGFSSQYQASRSNYSVQPEVFWTICPFCTIKYQYSREYVNKNLMCQKCKKPFLGCEIGAPRVSLASKRGQPVASRPDANQSAFQEKVVIGNNGTKIGVKDGRGPLSSKAHPPDSARRETVGLGFQTGQSSESIHKGASKEDIDPKAEETNSNANFSNGGKKGRKFYGEAFVQESRGLKNNIRKRGSKQAVESSESCDTSSDSDVEVILEENFGYPTTDQDSGPVRAPRRSSRRRQYISYNESDDDVDLGSPLKKSKASRYSEEHKKEQRDAVAGKDCRFHGDADYHKAETKEMGTSLGDKYGHFGKDDGMRGEANAWHGNTDTDKSDSDNCLSPKGDSDTEKIDCPEPEFSDFEKNRDKSCFSVNQFWACYDTFDHMPRFYAKVKDVCDDPFEVTIQWLEAVPIDQTFKRWINEELPVGCGTFKMGHFQKMDSCCQFSHQVHCERMKKRGHLTLYPRKGEVWALFKDWNCSWTINQANSKETNYEIVEVLSDIVAGTGIKVGYLDKVPGFVSLFQSRERGTDSVQIGPTELYRFSHLVPSFKMTGSERVGVPVGSFELDPASLPLKSENLFCPGKAEMESGHVVSGDNLSPQKSDKKRNNSSIRENTSILADMGG